MGTLQAKETVIAVQPFLCEVCQRERDCGLSRAKWSADIELETIRHFHQTLAVRLNDSVNISKWQTLWWEPLTTLPKIAGSSPYWLSLSLSLSLSHTHTHTHTHTRTHTHIGFVLFHVLSSVLVMYQSTGSIDVFSSCTRRKNRFYFLNCSSRVAYQQLIYSWQRLHNINVTDRASAKPCKPSLYVYVNRKL